MPSDSTRIRVFYQPVSHLQARNGASNASGIRVFLPPSRLASQAVGLEWYILLPALRRGHYHRYCAADITNPYYRGIITRSAHRATLIPVACGNLHYGLFIAPFAAVFDHVEKDIDHGKMIDLYTTTRFWKDMFNFFKLFFCDFYTQILSVVSRDFCSLLRERALEITSVKNIVTHRRGNCFRYVNALKCSDYWSHVVVKQVIYG